MVSSKLRYDIDFTVLLIKHTEKTIGKPNVDPITKEFLREQLGRLQLKLENYLAELPKSKRTKKHDL